MNSSPRPCFAGRLREHAARTPCVAMQASPVRFAAAGSRSPPTVITSRGKFCFFAVPRRGLEPAARSVEQPVPAVDCRCSAAILHLFASALQLSGDRRRRRARARRALAKRRGRCCPIPVARDRSAGVVVVAGLLREQPRVADELVTAKVAEHSSRCWAAAARSTRKELCRSDPQTLHFPLISLVPSRSRQTTAVGEAAWMTETQPSASLRAANRDPRRNYAASGIGTVWMSAIFQSACSWRKRIEVGAEIVCCCPSIVYV
jgi:hypothetical protein